MTKMIIAELNGKIPSNLNDKEDILTSNVFSFFKYSNRKILQEYLSLLEIEISIEDSQKAEFVFWHSFDDGTEPDLIIICGKYYLLFEAKLYSDFSPKTLSIDSQIEREIKMGMISAKNLNKEFVYIALTAEYFKNKSKYSKYENDDFLFIWSNWQTIAYFIYNKQVENNLKEDKEFADDLYSLFLKKRLRSFTGISNIKLQQTIKLNNLLFYNQNTSKFKGEFSGFLESLQKFDKFEKYSNQFKKSFFKTLIEFSNLSNDKIYYNGN